MPKNKGKGKAVAGSSGAARKKGDKPQYPPVKLRESVFGNDVFWRLLGKQLTLGDLKECRLVSRSFNQKVLQATNFKSRSEILLNRDRLQGDVFGSTSEKWRNIRFGTLVTRIRPQFIAPPWCSLVDDPEEDDGEEEDEEAGAEAEEEEEEEEEETPPVPVDWFYGHLAEVEELVLDAFDCTEDGITAFPPVNLNQVLESTKCLKKLSVNQLFLHRQPEGPIPERTGETLKNLLELELLGFTKSTLPASFAWKNHFAESLKSLWRLRTDGIMSETVIQPNFETEFLHPADQKFILDVIEANRSTLKTLKLHDAGLWVSSGNEGRILAEKEFPLLNSVMISLKEENALKIVQFLRKHPLLESMELTVYNQWPVELTELIVERKNKLKRLNMRTHAFKDIRRTWIFLKELVNLETFSMEKFRPSRYSRLVLASSGDSHHAMLSNLPPKVKNVRLEMIGTAGGFDPPITPETLSALNASILTELCLSKCGGCIGDEGMEFVCRNFLNLRVLTVTDTDDNLSDSGFIGPSEHDDTPFCISNIKGLRSLTLSSCEGVTDDTLENGVKFRELRYLDISNNQAMSDRAVRRVLAQNPCLETLRTSEWLIRDSIETLRKICPRLKQHIQVPLPIYFDPMEFLDFDDSDYSDEDFLHDFYDSDEY